MCVQVQQVVLLLFLVLRVILLKIVRLTLVYV